MTIRIHNVQNQTEAYKTYNRICGDTECQKYESVVFNILCSDVSSKFLF
jgi:hypothetical protein